MKIKIKIIFLIISLVLILNLVFSCNQYESTSNDVNNYFKEEIFLDKGDKFKFDINAIKEQFKNSDIAITTYELNSSDDSIVTIKKNITTAKGIGRARIYGSLYDKDAKIRYLVDFARVYVIDEANMTEIKTAQDLANIAENKSGN